MINESSNLQLNKEEKEKLIIFVSNYKNLCEFKKSEDQIADEFILHMTNNYQINTMDVTLAYHSTNQDMLLKSIIKNPSEYTWNDIKQFGIPLWIKNINILHEIIEVVAKTEFIKSQEKGADKINKISLYYILLKKKGALASLYKNTQEGNKIYEFILHDFAEDRWKKAANRNAYQLLSQKKYIAAAAFYLLGNHINEAVQVALVHLKDIQLAVTICRLMEGDNSEELKNIYSEYYIGQGTKCKDPWLTSLGYWLCGKHMESLNCFNIQIENNGNIKEINIFCLKDREDILLLNEWNFDTPKLTGFRPSMIILSQKLKKHYLLVFNI